MKQHKLLIITGTPGTGKTTLAKKLAKKLGWIRLDLHDYYKQISSGYDRSGKCYIIDLKKLERLVLKKKEEGNLIFDSHISHLLPKKIVDWCVVLTCSDLKVLEQRLKKRKYGAKKIKENLEAEIFQVCLEEATEKGQRILLEKDADKIVSKISGLP